MTIIHHIPLVLASGSAIRAQMLKKAGLQFSVAPSAVDEDVLKQRFETSAATPPSDSPPCRGEKGEHREPVGGGYELLAAALAQAKALAVAKDYPDHLTIGADQIAVSEDGIILDKPGTRDKAIAQLKSLSGKTHRQISAVCVVRGDAVVWETVQCATLTLRRLDDAEIAAYVDADQPLQSCGAYKFESLGRHLFAKVEGSDDVIQGLPLTALLTQLHAMGVIALS